MTGVDWIIVGLVLLLALFGWAQGFMSGVLAFAGLAGGAWLGTRIGAHLLSGGARSPWAPAFGLLGALLLGSLIAGLFGLFGAPVRRALAAMPGFGAADGFLGALLIAAVGLGIVWILGALAIQAGGYRMRQEVQRSAILQRLNTILPPSGPLLNSLRALDPFPRIDGPQARVARPRAGIARDAEVQEAAASVVKVLGSACGLGIEGSGWVAGAGLVVTNAHVVAGQRDTSVLLGGREPGRSAQAVHFDPRNDLAVLRVEGLAARPLALAREVESGTSAAILGFPLNGPFDVRPGRLGPTRRVQSSDAYGRGPVQRSMTALRGLVRSGNSGGPMVDGDGRVVTTIFAATTSGARGGYGVPNTVVARALPRAGGPVSTGPCAG
ncbi:MAG TPA: MarP family serine protease [Solirubrobacteraceae bacterium]|nr:MarP family serine protease [Solirubrobacteraceae bacterium]